MEDAHEMGLTQPALVAWIAELKAAYGEWSDDIPPPHAVWTRGNQGIPHTRLKRCVQVLRDVLGDRFSSASILDQWRRLAGRASNGGFFL
jgi:hypothetical protein